jgi:hypothetical protein
MCVYLIPEQTTYCCYTTIIIIITMAQQPYMGSGLLLPPLSKVTESCAFVAVGDWPTGRAVVLSILMCPPVRRLGGEREANLAYVTFLFMPVRFFYMP